MFSVVFYLQMIINDFCEPHLTASSLMPSEIHLSPYLRLGCLSPRLFYQRITQEYIKVCHSLRLIKNISVIILSDPSKPSLFQSVSIVALVTQADQYCMEVICHVSQCFFTTQSLVTNRHNYAFKFLF